jgi:hypothetical protein
MRCYHSFRTVKKCKFCWCSWWPVEILPHIKVFSSQFYVRIILRNDVVLFNEESFKTAISFIKRTLVQKILLVKSKVLMAVNTKFSVIWCMMQRGSIDWRQNVVECVCVQYCLVACMSNIRPVHQLHYTVLAISLTG